MRVALLFILEKFIHEARDEQILAQHTALVLHSHKMSNYLIGGVFGRILRKRKETKN